MGRLCIWCVAVILGWIRCGNYAIAGNELKFHLPCDGTIAPAVAVNATPIESRNVKFVDGKFGKAIFIARDARLAFPLSGNLDKHRGTICMWIKPTWDGDDGKNHGLFSDDINFADIGGNNLYLWKWSVGLLRFDVRDPSDHYLTADVKSWRAGEWHHIAAAWDCERGTWLFIDGRLVATRSFTWKPKQARKFFIGANWNCTQFADSALDDVRIFNVPLTEGQVRAVMAGRVIERVAYESIRVPRRVRIEEPFNVALRFKALDGLSRSYRIRVSLDDFTLNEFTYTKRIPPKGDGVAGPFKVKIPWWLYISEGRHTLSVKLDDAFGIKEHNARATILIHYRAFEHPLKWRVTKSGEVLCNGKPFLPRKRGYGFLFDGEFYTADADGIRMAVQLVKSGRIVDALRCRLIDQVDCSQTDHDYWESAPAKVIELIPGRKFRITGDPKQVSQTRKVYGRERKVLPAFSYQLAVAPRPTPHILVIESINDIERYLEVAIDAVPPVAPHLRGVVSGSRWVINLGVIYTGRERPCDGKPFRYALMFFPKSERIEVTISSSCREQQHTELSGAAVSRMWVYELLDPLPALANRIYTPHGKQRTVSLFYPHAPLMFDEYGFSRGARTSRESSTRLMMDYLKFIGFNRLEFHPYAFSTRAYFKSKLFESAGNLDVFDEVLPIAERAGIQVLPRVDSLVFFDKVLEADPDNFQQGVDGKVRQYFGKVPDPLRPQVQELLFKVLREMLEKTHRYKNVPGVGFRANAKFGILFVGSHWTAPPQESCYSKWDVQQFERDTGITVNAQPDDHRHRYLWLKEHAWEQWINWRCRKMYQWWQRARNIVNSHGKMLFVMTIIPYDHHFPSEQTQWFGKGIDPLTVHRYHGYDPRLYANETGLVISRAICIGADRYFRRRHNRAWWHHQQVPTFYATKEGTAVELYFIYWELPTHPKGFRVGPESPLGRAFLEPLTHAMRTMNPYWITFYNWHRATIGHEMILRQFCRAFRALPAKAPTPFDGEVRPTPDEHLWIRWFDDRLCIVNDADRKLTLRLTIPKRLPRGGCVLDVATNQMLLEARHKSLHPIRIQIQLRPYDMRTLIMMSKEGNP